MKTKFFKKLSFVLVVAMVLSLLVPAAGVFAATKPELNSTKKYLYLGRDDANEFNFNINNKQKGWQYYWESADEDVVVVDEKNGVVTAVGVGKTEVTVEITDADDEEIATLVAAVTVRDIIVDVTIKNPVEGTLGVNAEHDFDRSYVTESGSKKKTDSITRWEVDSEDASIDDKGVFVATKAGEYKVTARSFQSKARYNAWSDDAVKYADYVLATATTKVTVSGSMVSAKQADKDTVNVTFDSAMTDVDKNITVYQLVGTTKVKQTIAKVEMDDAKKVAAVSFYIPFATGATYQVEYTGMDSVSFVAATTKAEDVASMIVDTTIAEVNKEKAVAVKLFNAEGVEITTDALLTRVTMKSAGEAGTWFDAATKKVLIFEIGKTTVITATYHSYKYDNTGKEIGNVEAVGTVIGVDKDSTNITGLNAWTIVASSPNFYDVKQVLAADDYGKKLYVKLNNKTGSNTGNDDSNANPGYFDFTSSDESILIVDQVGNLYPVKEGTVTVIVKYATSGTKVPVATVTITVSAKKTATNFTLSTYEFSLSNTAGLGGTGDNYNVKLTMKDQLQRAFDFTEYKIDRLSAPVASDGTVVADQLVASTGTIAAASTNGELNVNFNAGGKTKGTYVYKITVKDIARVVTINVLEANSASPSYYKLVLDTTSKDMKVDGNTGYPVNVGIKLFGYSSNGVKVEDIDLNHTTDSFKVEIDAPWDSNGKFVDSSDNQAQSYAVVDTFTVAGVTGSVIYKAPVGSYKVTAYGPRPSDSVVVALDTVYFTTSDSQSAAVLSDIKSQVYSNTLTPADIANPKSAALILAVGGADNNNGLKFKVDGSSVSIIEVEAVGKPESIAVKTVTVAKLIKGTAGNADAVYLYYKVNVGLNLNKK